MIDLDIYDDDDCPDTFPVRIAVIVGTAEKALV